MEHTEPQPTLLDGGREQLDKKRRASEEPITASGTKRIKTAHNESAGSDIATPAIPWRPAVLEERNGEIEFRVVNNDGAGESVVVLTGLKCLFQKQLPKMRKDYEGGTLMLCSMLPRIRYLEVGRMLLKQKEVVQAKIRAMSKSHIVHRPPQKWANGVVSPIDPLAIPAIRATGWCLDIDDLSREPRHGPHFNELRRVLYQIQNHKQA